MKYLLLAIIAVVVCGPVKAQQSFTKMEDPQYVNGVLINGIADEPLPNPDPNITCCNVGEWAWNAGPEIGCGQYPNPNPPPDYLNNCDAGGNMSDSTQYVVPMKDGNSLQMNLVNVDSYPNYAYGCTDPSAGCYSDALFFNRLSTDNRYDWAFYSTLDLYAMTDNAGIANSQALEFVIEDDVTDPDDPSYTDTYTFGAQCDFMGTQEWNIWGSYVDPKDMQIHGKWVPAYDASTGQTIPCQASTQFYPPNFNHYIFHFERLLDPVNCYKCDLYLDFTIVYGNGNSETHQLGCGATGCNNWGNAQTAINKLVAWSVDPHATGRRFLRGSVFRMG